MKGWKGKGHRGWLNDPVDNILAMFDACRDENDEGKDKLGRTWIVGAWLDRLIASFHGPLILYVPAGLWFSYKHILHRRICTRYCARAKDREKRGREGERAILR